MKNKSQKAITQLVDRGFALHEQISLLTEEFKTIKTQLKTEAVVHRSDHLPLLDKDSEGTQWVVVTKECECRIVFPDAKIKTEFEPSESDFLTIRSLSGDRFKDLFQKAIDYRPTERKTFRCQVNQLLPTRTAKQLLELCTSPTEPKSYWKPRPSSNAKMAKRS